MANILDYTEGTSFSPNDGLYLGINLDTTPLDRWGRIKNFFKSWFGDYNVLAYNSLSLAITALGSTQETLIIPTSTTVSASLTVPSNITLYFTGPGMISVASGQTLTINGPILAPLRQIFTGSGSVRFGNRVEADYLQWFGGVMDGTTDDSAAFQKAVDAWTGTGNTFRAGIVKLIGPCAIGSTILSTLSGVIIEGTGWGAHVDGNKRGYLRWVGTTAIPMLKFQDCVRSGVKNLRIIGKSTGTKPSAAVQFHDTGGSSALDQPVLEDVWIGSYYNSDSDTGVQFTTGVLMTGTVNGDSGVFKNVSIQQCVTGVDIQNGNASVSHWDLLQIGQCTTGFKSVAPNIQISTFVGYSNEVDFNPAAQGFDIIIDNYFCEGSGRMIQSTAAAPIRFVIRGGHFGALDTANGGLFGVADSAGKRWLVDLIDNASGNGLWLEIRNFTLFLVGTPAIPVIRVTQPGGGAANLTLILSGVKGFTSTNFDVGTDSSAASSRTVIFERQAGNSAVPPLFTRYIFDSNEAEDRAYQDMRFDIPGKATIYGGPVKIKRLTAPNLAVTAVGGTGTTYSYKVSAVTRDGETLTSSASTVSGGATLSSSVYNVISMNPVVGAHAYNIYGRTSGSELLLKTFTVAEWADTFQAGWRDDGTLTPSGALPLRNSTGNLIVAGMFNSTKGDDVASAATIIPSGNVFTITGTTTISTISATGINAGTVLYMITTSALTFDEAGNIDITGGTSLTTTANYLAIAVWDGTKWRLR